MVVKQDPLIKPRILLGVIYFGLQRVSLAEYILILRVYSLLFQMMGFITATASIVSTLRGMKTRSWAWSSMLSFHVAFAGYDYGTGLYLN